MADHEFLSQQVEDEAFAIASGVSLDIKQSILEGYYESQVGELRVFPKRPSDMSREEYARQVAAGLKRGDEPWTDSAYHFLRKVCQLRQIKALDLDLEAGDEVYFANSIQGLGYKFGASQNLVWEAFVGVHRARLEIEAEIKEYR